MKRIDTYTSDGSLEYVAWQDAKTECCLTGRRDGLETMHVVHVGMGGNRKKPNPRHYTTLRVHYTVHRDHHSMTSKEFYDEYGVDLWEAVSRQITVYFQDKMDYKLFVYHLLAYLTESNTQGVVVE